VTIDKYAADCIAGGSNKTISGSPAKVNLEPAEALVIKVTPAGTIDFSGISVSRYVDFSSISTDKILSDKGMVFSKDVSILSNDYSWARSAVDTLDKAGIINNRSNVSYGPGQKITRGEFAMFLIRTLGITADTSDNFSDVNANAPYAKELAIGKASGILKGMGDNKYDPEAYISRQDLMTIIARGMKLTGKDIDLSGFTDANLIADYALDSVKAMIAVGLVKGNADQTINPRGNATRAEAAVIMQRILSN